MHAEIYMGPYGIFVLRKLLPGLFAVHRRKIKVIIDHVVLILRPIRKTKFLLKHVTFLWCQGMWFQYCMDKLNSVNLPHLPFRVKVSIPLAS